MNATQCISSSGQPGYRFDNICMVDTGLGYMNTITKDNIAGYDVSTLDLSNSGQILGFAPVVKKNTTIDVPVRGGLQGVNFWEQGGDIQPVTCTGPENTAYLSFSDNKLKCYELTQDALARTVNFMNQSIQDIVVVDGKSVYQLPKNECLDKDSKSACSKYNYCEWRDGMCNTNYS